MKRFVPDPGVWVVCPEGAEVQARQGPRLHGRGARKLVFRGCEGPYSPLRLVRSHDTAPPGFEDIQSILECFEGV